MLITLTTWPDMENVQSKPSAARVIDRPGEAGAVLQTVSSFTESVGLFLKYLQSPSLWNL